MTVGTSATQLNTMIDTLLAAGTYVQFHVGDPGAAGTANVSAVTTRQSVSFAAASGGSKAATGSPVAAYTATSTETCTHVSFWSAITAGTFKCSAALSSGVALNSGDVFQLTAYSYALAPIAA